MKIFVYLFLFIISSYTEAEKPVSLKNYKQIEKKIFINEIEKYGLTDGDTLLDLGCGDAAHSAQIFRFYPNMFFVLEDIDIDDAKKKDASIKVAGVRKNFKDHCKYVIGRNNSIPLTSSSYRFILCRKTVHEFIEPQYMLKEIKRLLTDDGIIIVEEAIPQKKGELDPYCEMPRMTKEEVINLFTQNGFKFLSADVTTMNIKSKDDRNMNILKFGK